MYNHLNYIDNDGVWHELANIEDVPTHEEIEELIDEAIGNAIGGSY